MQKVRKNILPNTLASNPPCLLLLPNLAPTSGSSSTAGSSSPKLIPWGLGLAFCKSLKECYGPLLKRFYEINISTKVAYFHIGT